MQVIPPYFSIRIFGAPMPKPFFDALKKIEVEASTERASMFRLEFDLSMTALGDWDVTQIDIFRPLVPITISVSVTIGIPEVLINGYIREAHISNSNTPGQSTLEVVGMDATATLMNIHEPPMPRPNMPDNTIVSLIFGTYGITPLAIPTPSGRTIMDTTTMQRTTDIRFIKTIARRNAYECYVQPAPITGTDVGYFGPAKYPMPPTQRPLSVNFGLATNMESFDVNYAMLQPTTAIAVAVDPRTRVPVPAPVPVATEAPMGLEPTLTRILIPPIAQPAGTDAANAAELVATARSIVNRSSRALRGRGRVDGLAYGGALRVGLTVEVRGAGRAYSGTYYVTEVKHTISRSEYRQEFSSYRNAVGLNGSERFLDLRAAAG